MNFTLRSAVLLLVAALEVLSCGAVRQEILINDGWLFDSPMDPQTRPVHLPHCWNEDAYYSKDYYRGEGIYSRTLRLPVDCQEGKVYLKFDGIAASGEIFIDGKKVGEAVGGYSSHTFDITSDITPGKDHMLIPSMTLFSICATGLALSSGKRFL